MGESRPARKSQTGTTSWLRSDRAKALRFILCVKVYVIIILYILFLSSDLRNGDKGFFYRPEGQTMAERSEAASEIFSERLAPYDGQWYLDISEKGYRTLSKAESRRGMHPPGNYAFFPLLPGILIAVKAVVGEEARLAVSLFLLALLSALGALALWEIAQRAGINPYLSVILLLSFPTAVFQYALYTEGMFLLFSALTLLFALKRQVAFAAFAALLAALARPQGVLLVLPLFVELALPLLRRKEFVSRSALALRFAALTAPLAGFATLAVISNVTTGSVLGFIEIQGRWGRSYDWANVFTSIENLVGYGGPPMDLLGLVFGVGLLYVMWRRLPLSFALYGTGALLLPLATGSPMSIGRFMSVSVPHFLALALVLERSPAVVRRGLIAGFALCQIFVAGGLITWHLVG